MADKSRDDLPRHQCDDEDERNGQSPAVGDQPVIVIVGREGEVSCGTRRRRSAVDAPAPAAGRR
jgi:hypothetical protein